MLKSAVTTGLLVLLFAGLAWGDTLVWYTTAEGQPGAFSVSEVQHLIPPEKDGKQGAVVTERVIHRIPVDQYADVVKRVQKAAETKKDK